MKLNDQRLEFVMECPTDKILAFKLIEKAGRVCWHTEDKIDEFSALPFINRILKKGHGAVLETSNIVLKSKKKYINNYFNGCKFIDSMVKDGYLYIGGNVRAFLEEFRKTTIEQWYDDTPIVGFNRVLDTKEIPNKLKRITVKINTDRAVTHEVVRHRLASILQQSQRYVKYDGEMEFVKPSWYDNATSEQKNIFLRACEVSEECYSELRKTLPPEHARVVLNNQVETPIFITASLPEWMYIFKLRVPVAAYPQMRIIMKQIYNQFETLGLLDEDC